MKNERDKGEPSLLLVIILFPFLILLKMIEFVERIILKIRYGKVPDDWKF